MTDWKVEEADFNNAEWGPGRTVVWLANGVGLSIITPARNDYLREARAMSPDAIMHGWPVTEALADDDTYEVGALLGDGGFDRRGLRPSPGWREDNHDGIVYQRVSPEQINAYVASIGVRDERE
jgi:hypothetical protein